ALLLILTLAVLTGLPPRAVPAADESAKAAIDFAEEILPLLQANCVGCHGPDLQESNYRLDVRDKALAAADRGEPPIVPGKSGESPLIRYVSGTDEELHMPP